MSGERMELLERRKIQYDGVHCRFDLEQLSPGAMVLKISGTDVGEFGAAPMLTGSRFIHITAEFVCRFADLERKMWICTEPDVFDRALSEAQEIQ